MHHTAGAPVTGQADTLEPPEAIRMETITDGPQNEASIAYTIDPSPTNLDRLYRATIDHGQAIMRLIHSIEQRKGGGLRPAA